MTAIYSQNKTRDRTQMMIVIRIRIMYIYYALIDAMIAHMMRININTSFYTHAEHSPTDAIHTKDYLKEKTKSNKIKALVFCPSASS